MPLIRTLLQITNFRNPYLRTLVPSVAAAFGIQAAVAIPSVAFQSERFYDFSGSLTYLSCTALSLYLPTIRARVAAEFAGKPILPFPSLSGAFTGQGGVATAAGAFNWRQVALSAAVTLWTVRLGSFLLSRITAENGRDSRFDNIRTSPPKFFGAFMAQATWVSLCALPILAVNSIPPSAFASLASVAGTAVTVTDILGLATFAGGFAFEALADSQKSQWMKEKREKRHSEEFLTHGLWSKSRHPNYFGEVMLWTGIATTSAGVLASNTGLAAMGLSATLPARIAAVGMAGVSPAFVAFLLFKVSGIPMSEKKYDQRYANNPDYQKWKRETPMFFPKL
ncbi:MAG: hypothetical protein M1831_003633 [Alyxoria varia]|nr:MAG: hypothetical protein M1831_003633 [Alyxoria varia]